MNIIVEEKENLVIINKSKFIGIVKKVYDEKEIKDFLITLKDKYQDATHICYAYILPEKEKCSDDKEPSGTAGLPILDVLKKNHLCYTLAVVIRYFGGIKLGSNGLIRSYSSTISELINQNTKEAEHGYIIEVIDDYKNINNINYLLKDAKILKKHYDDKIYLEAIVTKKMLDNFSNISYTILKDIFL